MSGFKTAERSKLASSLRAGARLCYRNKRHRPYPWAFCSFIKRWSNSNHEIFALQQQRKAV
jgi:hypothetical protein